MDEILNCICIVFVFVVELADDPIGLTKLLAIFISEQITFNQT